MVDNSIASGSAMVKCRESLKHLESEFSISYCAIYVIPGKEKMVDYHFWSGAPAPLFPIGNILNHTSLEKSCFDIDGVLCADPTEDQNDDGPKYRDFVLNAPPLFIPAVRLVPLLPQGSKNTAPKPSKWLAKNNVKYNKLVMLDLPNKEARMKANSHAVHRT